MKKNSLYWTLLSGIGGIVLILVGFFTKSLSNESSIFGFGCGLMGASIATLYKNFYWSRPKNKPVYEEKIKNEQINLHDERKIMLRNKSGNITNFIMMYLLIILNIVFMFVGVDKWIVIILWLVIVFQFICGIVVFKNLSKKM